jgi:hypothetical protein
MAGAAAGAYQPLLDKGVSTTGNALQYGQPSIKAGLDTMTSTLGINPLAGSPANSGVIQSYMSPYVQAALQPQITALQTQLGQQHNQIGAQATQAGAFGDARQGTQDALADFYGNQNLSGLLANGYNTAFTNALDTAQKQEQLGIGEQQFMGNLGQSIGQLGLGQDQAMLAQGQQLANLGQMAQGMGITGANALYNAGAQQQGLQQQQLNAAYQQFLNQVNWPYQMLSVQESALSNSPYNITNSVTLPNANPAASTLGTFANVAGSLGSLFGGGSNAPFGGSAYH